MQLAWTHVAGPASDLWRPDSRPSIARRGEWCALIWHEGGAMSWRSKVRQRNGFDGRIVAHRTEDAAKLAAETTLDKVSP